jgi:predicted phage-related endonuclease
MKKHDCQQGSLQWLELRAGIVTASEADSLVSPKFKIRTGETPRTLLATKLAEKWCGPLPSFGAWATEQGHLLEDLAIPAYELETGHTVERVGFITADSGRIGCSPDGLLTDCGLEIKSLQPVHHIKCLLDGGIPDDYIAQIHFSMLVTGFKRWKLFLYSRRLPHMMITIERDDEIQETLNKALDAFLTDFDIAWERLCDKNGGPPPPRKVFVPSPESQADPRADMFQDVPI